MIDNPDFKWYPGCNPGFPLGPDRGRGHDITVHGDNLVVTNPGGGLYVVDISPLRNVSNPTIPQELGRCEYDHPRTHDGWMSKNMDYVFTTGEHFLEWGCQWPIGDVTVYDISRGVQEDMCSQRVAKYAPSTAVTTHYCYINEDLGYVANYNRGLRIIDLSDPTDPIEVGYYDTYLGPDIPSHSWQPPYVHGTVDLWPYYGNYISACDHDSGVFVLQVKPDIQPACVSGNITSEPDETPIGGAWVYSVDGDRGARSFGDGYYELKTASGPHTITVSALGFDTTTTLCNISASRNCMDNECSVTLQSNSSDLATAWNNGTKIVVDSLGRIHLVYQNLTLPHQHGDPSTASHSVIYASSTDRGISWEFTNFVDAYHPSLCVDGNSVPHMVLLKHLTFSPQGPDESLVHYWREEESGEWQSEVIYTLEQFGGMFRPSISIPTNAIIQSPDVVWEHVEGGISRIWYWNPSLDSPEEIVIGTGSHTVEFPTIANDASNTPHVLWQDSELGQILHTYREGVGNWHQPAFTVADDASHPCLDECEGMIYAVWEQHPEDDIFIGRFSGADWDKCQLWDTDYSSQFPVLEDSHVVWHEDCPNPEDYRFFRSKWLGSGLAAGITCGSEPVQLNYTATPSIHPHGCYYLLRDVFYDEVLCDRFYVVWTEDLFSHQRLVFKYY